ncbi:MAG: glycosyltransferase family 39 protein [Vicinamibacterales bacterium]
MIHPVRRHGVLLALLLILVAAAVVRFWGLGFGLPHTQARPDETHIIEAARTMLSGRLPRFYDYPWLYISLVSVLYVGYYIWGAVAGTFHSLADMVASWPAYWPPFFLLSRALAATFGTATVYVVFRLGRRLWDDTTALVAAAFMALAFIHARDSHFGTTDTALTFFIVLSVGLLMGAHQSGRHRDFALAGVAGGLGAATKYNAVLLIAPLVASYVINIAQAPDKAAAARDPRLFTYGLPFLAAFGIGIPFVVLDFPNFMLAMRELQSSMAGGDPRLGLQNGWVHHFTYSLHYGLGAPLLAASIAGSIWLVVRMPAVGLLLIAFPAAYYGVAGSLRNLFFRYTIPMVPFLCLAAAWFVTAAAAWLAERTGRPRALQGAATLGLAALVIAPSALNTWHFDRIIGQTDNRVLVSQWFSVHVPAGSSIVQSGSRYGLAQFERRMNFQEWTWDGASLTFRLKGRPTTGTPDWIVVQDSPLPSTTQDQVTQWLAGDYVLVTTFKALNLRDDLVYDRQDMFYVPFSGLSSVTRPGPNFAVYARRDAAFDATSR